jgi:hypothetical protein
VEAYFKFFHPLFQIADAQQFLGRYKKNGVQQINLLLLCSLFSVSASYISEPLFNRAEDETHKQFKEDIIKRAKLLFDLSSKNDKIILIQSSPPPRFLIPGRRGRKAKLVLAWHRYQHRADHWP